MSREAIEEAIEVLEDASADMLMETGDKNYYVEAIAVLRQALETEQEPVAWRYKYPDGFWRFSNGERVNGSDPIKSQALYTSPPKAAEWVGLTADEIWKCNRAKSGSAVEFHICYAHQNVEDFAESIEAKLKDKNHG